MVADPRYNRHAVYGAAIALIALGAFVHYGWAFAPPEHQAQVWNACGALGRLALMVTAVWRVRSVAVLAAAAWLACEEVAVMACSIAYIFSPWPVAPGQAQCSALLQFDLGRVGVVTMVLALLIAVKSYRCGKL